MNVIKNIFDKNLRDKGSFFLIAGPCVVEDETMTFQIAEKLKVICSNLNIPLVFKASFKKANRSRSDSFTGIGDLKGLELICQTGKKFGIPVISDVHSIEDIQLAKDFVDIIQIPAFLCRQTELLISSGKTGKPINIKKGQFLSPSAMEFAVNKVYETNNHQVMITERGTTFGYNDLVVDFRGIPLMKKLNVPIVLDVTHSLQQPNQTSGVTGGLPEMIETIAKAGIAAGTDGLFIETHPDPSTAKSDGANMLNLSLLEPLLEKLIRIRKAIL